MTDPTPDFLQATRSAYDTIARDYTAHVPDGLAENPLDVALLTAFAELVRANGPAPVADLGSGPGHVTARLHALGVPVFGIDLSPRMVALARAAHPGLRFHVGSMTRLDLPDRTLGGVLALYSTIHVPDDHLPTAFAEIHRTLMPGGQVLLGFQSGASGDEDRRTHLTERYGHEISLDFHWRTPETVCGLLAAAGLEPHARVLREPEAEPEAGRRLPRAFVLARKPGVA
ncbi:class I SAM-dependent methyltransferase [Streptomyces sp. NPDC001508]|uniref:class I SAM-dependent methyltransferase n=1 Tax=Streptomyces sp. NPDC001508 TaxID=3154656 RepID=UPI003332C16C